MRDLQIFILDLQGNQLGELDLTDSDSFALKLTKSIASINDLGRRNTSYSLDFQAPQTKNNNKLLSGLRFINATKEILGKKPCSILVDGNQIDRGFLYPFESKFEGEYTLVFRGLNNDWVEQLHDVELNELNWRDHITGLRTQDATEIFDGGRFSGLNVNNSDSFDLTYPYVNRNNSGLVASFRPQIHLRAIILAMFQKIDYTVSSVWLDSDWVRGVAAFVDAFGNAYDHYGLSVDPAFQMTREEQDLIGQSIEYKTSLTDLTNPNTWFSSDPNTVMGNLGTATAPNLRMVYRFPNIVNTLITDNIGRFNVATSEFTVGQTGKYLLTFDFQFEFAYWDLSGLPLPGNEWTKYGGPFVAGHHPPSFKWYVVKNNVSDTVINPANVIFSREIKKVGTPNTAQQRPQADIDYSTIEHNFAAGDKISVFLELLEDSVGHASTLGFGQYDSPTTGIPTPINPSAFPYWRMKIANNAVLKITPKQNIQLGDVFRINTHIPEGIKCLSLLQDFKTMFNLYFDVDVNRKIVTIEPRDDFYNNTVEDITDKVDLNTPPVLNYLTDYKNELVFRYKHDSKDKYLEQWNKIHSRTYAEYTHVFANNERFDKGESILSTSIIAASVQEGLEGTANIITSIIKEEYLDADNAAKPVNQNYGARVFQLVRGRQYTPANVPRRTSSPLVVSSAIMESYANTPTFEDRRLTFNGTNGLVEQYYAKTIANIEDTAVVELVLNMTLYEFKEWDMARTFYISEPAEIAGYYITDSIDNFNVTKDVPTKVRLVKFKDFTPVAIEQGTGNVNVITDNTPQPQPILCTVNGAIVDCLDNDNKQMFKI